MDVRIHLTLKSTRAVARSGFAFRAAVTIIGRAAGLDEQTRRASCAEGPPARNKRVSHSLAWSAGVGVVVEDDVDHALQFAARTLVDNLLAEQEVQFLEQFFGFEFHFVSAVLQQLVNHRQRLLREHARLAAVADVI